MTTLQLHRCRAGFGRLRQRGEVVSAQEVSSHQHSASPRARVRGAIVSPERIAEIRREIAAGVYLRKNEEEQITAIVDGLLHDLLTNLRHTGCRAAV